MPISKLIRSQTCHAVIYAYSTASRSQNCTAQALLVAASAGVQPEALVKANWGAVPAAMPVLSLAFVYQNVVPVLTSSLEVHPVLSAIFYKELPHADEGK